MPTLHKQTLASTLLVALVATAGDVPAGESWLDPARVEWRQASYHGRKLVFSLDAEVTMGFPSVEEVALALAPAGESDPLRPAGREIVAVRLESTVIGSHSTTVLYVDAHSGAALQRRQLRRKRDNVRFKTLRFAERGVQLGFHEPARGESRDDPHLWSGGSTRFAPYPPWVDRALDVSEPTALFYVLAVAPLTETGDVVRFPAFSKEELVTVELEVAGWEQIEVDYECDGQRIEGPVPALKVLVDAHPLDPGAKPNRLEVMGLHGAIEVHLDVRTRALLAVSGRVPYVGRAAVRIRSLTSR